MSVTDGVELVAERILSGHYKFSTIWLLDGVNVCIPII